MKSKRFVALALAVILALGLVTTPFAAYKGDINGDDLVNSSDALAVLRYSVGLDKEINKKAADMDADGNINSSDALAILKVSVGINDKEELPEEPETPEEPVVSYYDAMIALQEQYPEGTPWDNSNFYEWKGGIYSGGYGCAGFAFMLSDAAFGDAPATMLEDITIKDVRVGDILRMNNDTHSVIVLEVHEDYVIVAEGNYNNSVHWGREIPASEVASATYLLTRYDTLPDKDETTVPASKDEIVALYNNAVNKVVDEKAGYTKERVTTVSKIDAGSYTSMAGDIVKDFLGEGTNKFKNSKGSAKYFGKSTLTESDVKNATCELNGDNYTITLDLNDGISTATKSSKKDNSPVAKCGLLTGKAVDTTIDYINSECIYASVTAEKVNVSKITSANTNVKIVVVINAATGNMVSYTASFDWEAAIEKLSVSLISIKKATGNASTEVKLSDFNW